MASPTPSRIVASLWHIVTIIGALLLIGVILWLDFSTTIWQERVILSGLAAGLVSFLLTTVFINRFHQRAIEARWAPVTHMALTSLLHQLADEKHSDLSRGDITARTLGVPTATDARSLHQELEKLRHAVLKEQTHLAAVLGTWSEFLTSTGDNSAILRSSAKLALHLDRVRDAALEVERSTAPDLTELTQQIETCNQQHAALIAALQARRHQHAQDHTSG